jgi:hypothetical protein
MTPASRVGSRAPLIAAVAVLLASLLSVLPATALGAGWTGLKRVTDERESRLDSLHQLSADRGELHLVHPSIRGAATRDRVLYQRSADNGVTWSAPTTLFAVSRAGRYVVSNLALASRARVVAVAWRVKGPDEDTLFVRVSRDGGRGFEDRIGLFSSKHDAGIGVPAVAVAAGGKVVTVAWTDRANGKVKLRVSRNGGRTFGRVRIMGQTGLSIDCRERVSDGLVGLAATAGSIHVAWSDAPAGKCQASSIKLRTSGNQGRTWRPAGTVTQRRSYGWPELDARGKTVLATVQSPGGDIIVARSGDDGQSWSDRRLKAPKGANFSAADVVLLPDGKAMITYVNERLRKSRLIGTKVMSRWSPDDGASFRKPRTVAPDAERLRMAPNIAANEKRVTIVVQSGPLSGSPRNIYVSRLR